MNPFYTTIKRIHEQNQAVEIIYQSLSGEISHRIIYVNKLTPQFVYGYCTLRKTMRTFALQNILSAYPLGISKRAKSV